MTAKFFVSDKTKKDAPKKLKEFLENLKENVSQFDKHIASKCCEHFRKETQKIFDEVVNRTKKILGSSLAAGLSILGIIALTAASVILPPLVLVSPFIAIPAFGAITSTATAVHQGRKMKELLKSLYGKHKVEFQLGCDGSIYVKLCFGLVPLV